jgi:hypothetical protein
MHWIDPACLQETRGTVTQFLLNPRGELDGFILGTDKQVHFPPHLSRQVAKHVKVGGKVKVRGVKPRAADVVAAVQVTSGTGAVILDEGPHQHGEKHEKPYVDKRPMEMTGEVRLSLYGPKGELRGAVLFSYLEPGAHVQVWGHGVKNKYGRTIEVDDIAQLVDAEDLPETTA